MFRVKNAPDVVGGIVAVIIGLVSLSEGIRLAPMGNSAVAGDHTLPLLLGVVMVVLGLLLIFMPNKADFEVKFPEKTTLLKMIAVFAVMCGYWAVMTYLGYLLTTWLALIFLYRIMGPYPWKKSVLFAAVTVAVVYVVFVVWFNTMLPEGRFNI
jgi:putative tricarboxylic transport membrane protein